MPANQDCISIRYKLYADISSQLILLDPKASQMNPLIDANLAHIFGPEGTTYYLTCLLKVDMGSLHLTMSQEWPHTFFIVKRCWIVQVSSGISDGDLKRKRKMSAKDDEGKHSVGTAASSV